MRPTHDADRAATALDEFRRGDHAAGDGGWSSRELLGPAHRVLGRIGGRARRAPTRVVVAGAALSVVVAVIAAALLVRSSTGTRSGPSSMAPAVTVPAAAPTPTVATSGLVVQASGAVRSPGVHRLPAGARVVDLLERAGGPALDLDLDRVNLAAPLVDGQRVWFPRIGQSTEPLVTGATGSSSAPPLVDVNHASAEQLDSLPGIGPTLAAAIVSDRERHGAFRSVDDLLRVKGLSRSKVDAVRELVVVG